MAGIYIHIPYCKQKCSYCNFHFSTNISSLREMGNAIIKEIRLRKGEISKPVETIYFGGGTPSLLNDELLFEIFKSLQKAFDTSQVQEITLECNPDDITPEKLNFWKSLGINRLSIGVQSFFDEELQLMNRSHSALQSINSIKSAQNAGFENITIDLIYGSQKSNKDIWQKNLEYLNKLEIPHFSAYALTVEPKTLLDHQIKTGKLSEVSDSLQLEYFKELQNFARENNYLQYEVSNFGKEGKFSLHNSNYWKGKPYIGIGPSAHSYDGKGIRKNNIANNALYINSLEKNLLPQEEEILTENEKYNELIMIGLRSIYGVPKDSILKFDENIQTYFNSKIDNYIQKGMINFENEKYTLNPEFYFQADGIASDLFYL